jgi:hypothetical protein
MGLVDSPECDRCKQASETASHVLGDCEALAAISFRYLGYHFKKPGDFKAISVSRLLHFVQSAGLLNEYKGCTKDQKWSMCMGCSGARPTSILFYLLNKFCVACNTIMVLYKYSVMSITFCVRYIYLDIRNADFVYISMTRALAFPLALGLETSSTPDLAITAVNGIELRENQMS